MSVLGEVKNAGIGSYFADLQETPYLRDTLRLLSGLGCWNIQKSIGH